MHEIAELPGPGNGIVHSALNIFNILIKDSGRAVISGFGHSKVSQDGVYADMYLQRYQVIQGFEESFTGDNSEYRYMVGRRYLFFFTIVNLFIELNRPQR